MVFALIGMMSLAACASVPKLSSICTSTDTVTRFTEEQIDHMTDEQVRSELARAEELAARGCATPNK